MEKKSGEPEKWLEFDFPASCVLAEWSKNFSRRTAAESQGGGCCPYYFCLSSPEGHLCEPETARECAELCEKFYEKYVREGKK